jgi:hemerythrin
MKTMNWVAELETGVELVDQQHRELFRRVNMLFDHDQRSDVKDTLEFVGEYVMRHFADEEALQVASRYPGLQEHKRLHNDLIRIVLDLKDRVSQAANEEDREIAVMSVNGMVVDLLTDHVLIQDRRFAEWYKALETKTTL